MTGAPIVELVGASVEYPGTCALDRVDVAFRAGEVHALMGENGAGKSTLIGVLAGVVRLDEGVMRIAGDPVRFQGAADAAGVGIAAAFQEVSLCEELSVAENVMLGHEVRGRWGIDWRRTRERARQVLGDLGLDGIDVRLPVDLLSPPDRQLVSIARAMVTRPRVLLLDEPTASLEQSDVARLFAVVRRLRDAGVAIVYVSHLLEQVLAIADRLTVLRDGAVVDSFDARDVDRTELVSAMVGRRIEDLRRIGSERREHRTDPEGEPLYRAESLSRRRLLAPADLDLFPGEVVGVAGLRGAGRSVLARLIGGATAPDGGSVRVGGRAVTVRSPRQALALRIALSAEDRRREGLIAEMSVRDNVLISLQALRGWGRRIQRAEADDIVARCAEVLRMRVADMGQPVDQLSGGTQQKVLLARLLAVRPRILVLDEPTKGVDIAAKVDVQQHVSHLAADGVSVVFVSSELEELVRLSDRIVVMKDREIIGEISNGPAITADTVIEMIAADGDVR